MAVDDIIIVFSADNTQLSFQPAAGVEVIITSVEMAASAANLTDGTDTANILAFGDLERVNLKVGITNTVFIQVGAQGASDHSAITGVQTK